MKIALLGATGRLGQETLTAALLDGHDVRALVRRPEVVPGHAGVEAQRVDLSTADALAAQFAGVEAVAVELRSDRGEPHLLEEVLPRIADAARLAGVRRVVHVSQFGAGETAKMASLRARSVYATLEKGRLDDHARALAAIDTSRLEWTTLLPIRMRKGAPFAVHAVAPLAEVARVPGLPLLPYINVARTVLSLMTDEVHVPGPLVVTTAAGMRIAKEHASRVPFDPEPPA